MSKSKKGPQMHGDLGFDKLLKTKMKEKIKQKSKQINYEKMLQQMKDIQEEVLLPK